MQSDIKSLRQVYDKAFYAAQVAGSARSAAAVVPRILELFPDTRSVVDVGCGTGTWLHQFSLEGVPRVLGLDGGDAPAELLHIPSGSFVRRNLAEKFDLGERFDLAITLEVAEHLPASSADGFVDNLTDLSDCIVFGAAIPGQGGTQHINERWASYWVSRFQARGYTCFDLLRPVLWYDERVEWWYRQNTLLFVKSSRREVMDRLAGLSSDRPSLLDVVHPQCFSVYRESGEAASALAASSSNGALASQSPDLESSTALIVALRDVERLRARLEEIERSAGWRAILAGRRLVTPYPRLRAFARGCARFAANMLGNRAGRRTR